MTIARYNTTFGLQGCYMPDYVGGPLEFTTRKGLVDHIKYELQMLDLPAYLIRQVKLRNLWRHIKRHGSSSAHFHIAHGHNVLSFRGLTKEEFTQQEAEFTD